MIPLLQTKTADTAHMRIFASDTRPYFPDFWVRPGDEASHKLLLVALCKGVAYKPYCQPSSIAHVRV